MRNVSMIRTGLALAAVLLVAGPSLILAATPGTSYIPKGSVLLGPTTVAKGTTNVQYRLQVTFSNGSVFTFPTDTPAPNAVLTFGAVFGSFPGNTNGLYNAPAAGAATGSKDRITASYTENGVQAISSLTVNTP